MGPGKIGLDVEEVAEEGKSSSSKSTESRPYDRADSSGVW